MFVRSIAAAVAFLVVLGADSSANAQSATTLHGVGSASVAYTDNMLGSPTHPAQGQDGPIGVWFIDLSPGIRIIHESRSALYTLTYAHPFTFYLADPTDIRQSDVGLFTGVFALSARDELTFALSALRSDTRAAILRAQPNQTVGVHPQATGQNLMLQADLAEEWSHDFTGQWRMIQRSGFGTIVPLLVPEPQPYRYQVLLGAGPEYRTARNAYGVDFDATYFYITEVNEGAYHIDSSAQVIASGAFRWRHDLSETWSTELRLGLAGAVRADPVRGGVWGPIGLASVQWADEGYDAQLSFQRTLGPDLVTATTMMADQVLLTAGVPLSREYQIVLRAGAGYAHNRGIQVEQAGFLAVLPFATPSSTKNARLVTTYDSYSLDVSLGWYPEELPYVELRYQHLEQIGVANQAVPASTYYRNLIMLTAGIVWPSRLPPQRPD